MAAAVHCTPKVTLLTSPDEAQSFSRSMDAQGTVLFSVFVLVLALDFHPQDYFSNQLAAPSATFRPRVTPEPVIVPVPCLQASGPGSETLTHSLTLCMEGKNHGNAAHTKLVHGSHFQTSCGH